MKLYLFQCGTIRTKRHLLMAGYPPDETFEKCPCRFFLIHHPAGKVLFDAGQPLVALRIKPKGDYIPIMHERDHVSEQLGIIGLKPSNITHVIFSHLHSDHAGELEAFLNAVCYIQEDELQYNGNQNWRRYS